MGLGSVPRLTLFTKWDQVSAGARLDLLGAMPEALPVSAHTGAGLAELARAVEKAFFEDGLWQRHDPRRWRDFAEESRHTGRESD